MQCTFLYWLQRNTAVYVQHCYAIASSADYLSSDMIWWLLINGGSLVNQNKICLRSEIKSSKGPDRPNARIFFLDFCSDPSPLPLACWMSKLSGEIREERIGNNYYQKINDK